MDRKTKEVPKGLKTHEVYQDMYWVFWDDGDSDFFNKTWAVEHLRRMREGY